MHFLFGRFRHPFERRHDGSCSKRGHSRGAHRAAATIISHEHRTVTSATSSCVESISRVESGNVFSGEAKVRRLLVCRLAVGTRVTVLGVGHDTHFFFLAVSHRTMYTRPAIQNPLLRMRILQ